MLRLFSHMLHVSGTRSHVFRRNILTGKRLDEPPMRAEDRFSIDRVLVSQDDRLPTTERHRRERIFVSHATRKSQQVVNRFVFGLILPEPRAADRGTKVRVMNRY